MKRRRVIIKLPDLVCCQPDSVAAVLVMEAWLWSSCILFLSYQPRFCLAVSFELYCEIYQRWHESQSLAGKHESVALDEAEVASIEQISDPTSWREKYVDKLKRKNPFL